MTKHELIDAVHEAVGGDVSKRITGEVIDATFKALTTGLVGEEGRVFIPGFGTFQVKSRAARTGRNPRTGEEIQIPASKTVGFKVAAGLKGNL
ncbi:MAG: HU family DNA-binding protein [Bradymonadia bacterium]